MRLRSVRLLSLLLAVVPSAAAQGPRGDKVAVVVGVNRYNHSALNSPEPLRFAERDAAALARLLEQGGYKVRKLLGAEATLAALRRELRAAHTRPGADGLFLVALAGHGLQPEKSNDPYYAPFDAGQRVRMPGDRDPDPWDYATMLKLEEVVAYLKASPAGTRVLLVDACRNDTSAGRGRSPGVGPGVQVGDLPDNTAILLSCSRGQRSFEHERWGGGHGAFFHHILEGIRGKAADVEGRIGADELWKYVKDNVPIEVRNVIGAATDQRPFRLVTGDVDLRLDAVAAPGVAAVKESEETLGALKCKLTKSRSATGVSAVVEAHFDDGVSDDAIRRAASHLAALPKLRAVDLSGTDVGGRGLGAITEVRQLQQLLLNDTRLRDDDLAALSGLRGLETLQLARATIGDAGLKEVGRLTKLRYLSLNGTRVSDAGLRELASLRELVSLDLRNTAVRGPGLARLDGLKKLERLYLGAAALASKDAADLTTKSPRLRVLE